MKKRSEMKMPKNISKTSEKIDLRESLGGFWEGFGDQNRRKIVSETMLKKDTEKHPKNNPDDDLKKTCRSKEREARSSIGAVEPCDPIWQDRLPRPIKASEKLTTPRTMWG